MRLKKELSPLLALMYLILATLVILSLYNLFYNRSFWIDEAMLANSIVNRDYSGLLLPLEYDQVAPIGYLVIQKAITSLFDYTDWSFRIVSFLCYLGSIWSLIRLNLILFKSKIIAVLACILFALNPLILSYSIEAKPYMIEVLTTIILLLFYLNSQARNRPIAFTIACALSIWVSNISVIIITSIFIVHFYQFFKNKRTDLQQFSTYIIAGISFLIYYLFFIHNHPAKTYMIEFWEAYGGFSPKGLDSRLFYLYHFSRIKSICMMLVYRLPWIATMVLIGIALIKYLRMNILVSVGLIALSFHFGLAYLRLYPYSARTMLYIYPLLLSLIAAGAVKITDFLNEKTKIPTWHFILIVPLVWNMYSLWKTLPNEKENIKQALIYLNDNFESSDDLYLFYASKPNFDFYKNSYLHLNDYKIIGENNVKDCSLLIGNEGIKDSSIWIIYTLNYPRLLVAPNMLDNFIKSIEDCSFKEISRESYKNVIVYEFKKIEP